MWLLQLPDTTRLGRTVHKVSFLILALLLALLIGTLPIFFKPADSKNVKYSDPNSDAIETLFAWFYSRKNKSEQPHE